MAYNFRLFQNPRMTKTEMKAHIRRELRYLAIRQTERKARRERRKVQAIRREYARRQVQDGLFSL